MDEVSKKIAAIEKGIHEIKQNMSTKDDIKNLESRIVEKIDEAQMEIIETVDKHKADKEGVRILEKRVERLENSAGLPPLD